MCSPEWKGKEKKGETEIKGNMGEEGDRLSREGIVKTPRVLHEM